VRIKYFLRVAQEVLAGPCHIGIGT